MDDEAAVLKILEAYPTNQLLASSASYVYFGILLETFAKEKLISTLWKHLATLLTDPTEQRKAARRLREGLLKASPLVGFPRAINGLSALHESVKQHTPTLQSQLEADKSLRAPVPKEERIRRGRAFWNDVYSSKASSIEQHLYLISGGDLSEFAITGIYGDLMAECSILSEKETGLLEFVACFAAGAAPQAKGHMYGARNLGNSRTEVEGAIKMCRDVAKLVGVTLDESEMGFVQKVKEWD